MRVRISPGIVAIALALDGSVVARADVNPGDVITAAEAEKVRGLIPDALYPFAVQDFADLPEEAL